jgi:hypothetical protein
VIFDLTGSYQIAFLNGLAWNALNMSIVVLLLLRARGGRMPTLGRPMQSQGTGNSA